MHKHSVFSLAIILSIIVYFGDGRTFDARNSLLERLVLRSVPAGAFCCNPLTTSPSACDSGASPIRQIATHPTTHVGCERPSICQEDCKEDQKTTWLLTSPLGSTCVVADKNGGDHKKGHCCPRILESSCPSKTCAKGEDLLRRLVPHSNNIMYCPRCPVCTSECPAGAKIFQGSTMKICFGKE